MEREPNAKALLPILIFAVLYLTLGIVLEYVLNVNMGFYVIPTVGVFMVALLVACIQHREIGFDEELKIMSRGPGDKNIFMMILIFMTAGAFVGIVGRSSAESVAHLFLNTFPPEMAVITLFVVAMIVSLAMGTSVGTITLITPIAVAVSLSTGFSCLLCVGAVIGGSMFGDNLSFISDTTIAACQGQGCEMKDKFKSNFLVALPAAIVSIVIFFLISQGGYSGGYVQQDVDLVLIIPYIIVLGLSIVGVNVFISLLIGIVSGMAISLGTGRLEFVDMLSNINAGISGMFETAIVAVLVSAIIMLVIEFGGFEAIMDWIKRHFKSKKGGMLGIGLLVSAMDISTANNTVAIVMANPLAKDISEEYGISSKRTASILDSFSCVFQGIIPYGAQLLVATGAIATTYPLYACSSVELIPYVVYPFMLLAAYLVFILVVRDKEDKTKAAEQ